MTPARRQPWEIRAVLPASLEAIEPFLAGFRIRYCECASRADLFAAELLLREALTNAVVHGCGQDPSMQVRCAVRVGKGRWTMTVADEGPGFGWRKAMERRASRDATSGRGMEILRTYATRIRFNARGNALVIVKCFEPGESR